MAWADLTACGLISGATVALASHWLAGRGLRRQAGELRRLNVLLLGALRESGLAELRFDGRGSPTGVQLHDLGSRRGTGGGPAADSVTAHQGVVGVRAG